MSGDELDRGTAERPADLLRTLRSRYPPRTVLPLCVLDIPMALLFNDSRVANTLRECFAANACKVPGPHALRLYLLQGEPTYDVTLMGQPATATGCLGKESCYDTPEARVVLNRINGVVTYLAGLDLYVVGDLAANPAEASKAVELALAEAMLRRGRVTLEASATVGPAGGVAFVSAGAGPRGDAAQTVSKRGHRLVAGDRLLLAPVGDRVEMVGLPGRFGAKSSDPHGAALSGSAVIPLDEVRHRSRSDLRCRPVGNSDHDSGAEVMPGAWGWGNQGILKAVYLLRPEPSVLGWHIRSLGRSEGLAALEEVGRTAGRCERASSTADRRALLLEVIEIVPVYEVSGAGNTSGLDRLILACLSGGQSPTARFRQTK